MMTYGPSLIVLSKHQKATYYKKISLQAQKIGIILSSATYVIT